MKSAMIATVLACLFNGAFVAWSVAGLREDQRIAQVRAIGEANLQQAERMLQACFRHGAIVVGSAIYKCRAEKSELTTAQVPELGKSIAVF